MNTELRQQEPDACSVLEISGSVIGGDALSLHKELAKLARNTNHEIAVDLRRAPTVDSAGLGVLIYMWQILSDQGRELLLLNPSTMVTELLESSNLDKVFKVVRPALTT
jgi:anti-anti-sigma factor